MLWQRVCGYGHVWIKISSTTQLLSGSALSEPPPPRAPGRRGFIPLAMTSAANLSLPPSEGPVNITVTGHTETENRGTHTHTCTRMHTHTNLFAAWILFGRDVFSFLFFLTANSHITLLRKENTWDTRQKQMLTQHIDSSRNSSWFPLFSCWIFATCFQISC